MNGQPGSRLQLTHWPASLSCGGQSSAKTQPPFKAKSPKDGRVRGGLVGTQNMWVISLFAPGEEGHVWVKMLSAGSEEGDLKIIPWIQIIQKEELCFWWLHLMRLPQKSLPSPISRLVHDHLVPLTILCFLLENVYYLNLYFLSYLNCKAHEGSNPVTLV